MLTKIKNHPKRRLLVILLDIVSITVAFALAFLLRFDFNPPAHQTDAFSRQLLVVVCVQSLVFLTSNLYRSLWRYASRHDAMEIVKTTSYASFATFAALLFALPHQQCPRSVYLMDWVLLTAAVTCTRLVWAWYRDVPRLSATGPDGCETRLTLIVGAGQAGSMLCKEIRGMADSPYQIVGFVDDDERKKGTRLNGVPVVGTTRDLKNLILKTQATKVLIAIPSAPRMAVRDIVRKCETAHVKFMTLPGLGQILGGQVSISQIKDVDIEDLLGRDPVEIDASGISAYLAGKCVLVSGAGGSIGSEICRQIAGYLPAKLVILDSAETPLFHIERELNSTHPRLQVVPIIADVRNKVRIEGLFGDFQPEVVFHAAAYKHVPMMEYNPLEAVGNNIGGTKVLADASDRFRVGNFVMISTDKAVNPTNIMGATKRAAELYVQALAQVSTTCFTTVRFGNVLGSNGSVIPIFREQIKCGGPVTVTDPEVVRFFMTIPEASQLVLQAGCLGNSGEIFVLDMGEPVKIVELAEEVIRLSGFTPYEDIDIVFSGLRPGEKLYEELLLAGEGILPTVHAKIKVLASIKHEHTVMSAALGALLGAVEATDIKTTVKLLRSLVGEFTPQYPHGVSYPSAFKKVRPDLFPPTAALPRQKAPQQYPASPERRLIG